MSEESPRKFCGQCGRTLTAEARFCGFCGQAVPDPGPPGNVSFYGPDATAGTGTPPGHGTGTGPGLTGHTAPEPGGFPEWPPAASGDAEPVLPTDPPDHAAGATAVLPPAGPGLVGPGHAGPGGFTPAGDAGPGSFPVGPGPMGTGQDAPPASPGPVLWAEPPGYTPGPTAALPPTGPGLTEPGGSRPGPGQSGGGPALSLPSGTTPPADPGPVLWAEPPGYTPGPTAALPPTGPGLTGPGDGMGSYGYGAAPGYDLGGSGYGPGGTGYGPGGTGYGLASTQPGLPAIGAGPDGGGSGPGRRWLRLPGPGGWSRWSLLLGAVALIVLLGGVYAAIGLLSGSSPSGGNGTSQAAAVTPASPAPSQTAQADPAQRQAARKLAVLLSRSGADRTSVDRAVTDLNHCRAGIPADLATFRHDAASRKHLLARLAALPGRSALPPRMTRILTRAWKASAQADRDFAAWAAAQESSHKCKKNAKNNPYLKAAVRPDSLATVNKQKFVRMWNPLAARYGLQTYQWTQL